MDAIKLTDMLRLGTPICVVQLNAKEARIKELMSTNADLQGQLENRTSDLER